MPRYVPANSLESPRFTSVCTFMRLPFVQASDVVKILPVYDNPGRISALLAADMAWEMITLLALRKDLGA